MTPLRRRMTEDMQVTTRSRWSTRGQKCLAIHDGNGARKNYCLLCATAILHKAKTKLLALERDIQS
jgi:hypothetical protein